MGKPGEDCASVDADGPSGPASEEQTGRVIMAPGKRQQILDSLFERATRFQIKGVGEKRGEVVFESDDATTLELLRASLQVAEPRKGKDVRSLLFRK